MTEKDALDMVAGVIKAMAGPVAGVDMPAVDVADMRAVFKEAGGALYGSGEATGEGRATRAAVLAISDIKRQLERP